MSTAYVGVGGALAGCTSSGTPVPASSSRRVVVQHSFQLDAALGGIFLADQHGLFRQRDIAVKVLPGGAGVDPVVAVARGDALIGIHANAASVLLPFQQGAPLRVIATQYKRSPNGFLSKESRGWKAPSDYQGLRFGVLQSSIAVLRTVFRLNGISGEIVTTTPDGLLQLLLTDKVDVILGFVTNFGVQMDRLRVPYTFVPFEDLGYAQEYYVYFTSEAAASDKGSLLSDFIAATRLGWRDALAHPDEAAGATVEHYATSAQLDVMNGMASMQRRFMESPITDVHGLLFPDLGTWEKTNRLLVQSGQLASPAALNELVTTTFL
jgi:ABC-type nitrate/sulfonate/bicarbonate transport system substrate-binding protein